MYHIVEKMDRGWWVVTDGQQLWLPDGKLPYGEAVSFNLTGRHALHIGEWQGEAVWMIDQDRQHNMVSLRQLLDQAPGLFQLAGRGVQLSGFYRSHKYCGSCGHPMRSGKNEWAMQCDHCHERYYPQIAPCIIVAIRREDSILLAQHTRHRNGIHTALAGFVEVGETLEQAVIREVMEESQLQVKNIHYVTSQPWPFPQSLMAAFIAEYESGEIIIDKKELLEAGWYRYDNLPLLPPVGTVARRLIEDTVAMCRAEYE
ncbi:NAD(+) diphosphatase [Enterobacteriaceae bacterium ESL0689]|nr:NAD(+) diphosphatase [Enterobacteriaceae bacterium ESL0689]